MILTIHISCSLLSGTVSGTLHIHDLTNHSGEVKHTTKAVCNVSRSNPYKHKHSVETVQWYPLDTGMFLSSGTDRTLKIWDTNSMKVHKYRFGERERERIFKLGKYMHNIHDILLSFIIIFFGTKMITRNGSSRRMKNSPLHI